MHKCYILCTPLEISIQNIKLLKAASDVTWPKPFILRGGGPHQSRRTNDSLVLSSNDPRTPCEPMTCFSLCEKQQCSRETLTASLRHQQSTDGAAAAVALMAPTSEAKGWILGVPRQGWEMSADSATKEPSFPFWREERSFRFINSRLKRNYLPTDPNHQHKETRTKSSFFFQSLKDLKKKKKKEMLLVSSPHFWWVNQISQKESWRHIFKNSGGWKSLSCEVLTLHQWTFFLVGLKPTYFL